MQQPVIIPASIMVTGKIINLLMNELMDADESK